MTATVTDESSGPLLGGSSPAPGPRHRDLGLLSPDRWTVGIGLAVLVGLALRVVWVAYAARRPEGIFVDPARYLGFADQIAEGNGYTEPLTGEPTAYYPPGYPYFLGALAWLGRNTLITDDLPAFTGYVQAVLGALTAGLAGVVARRLFTPLAGVVVAAVVALWPNLIFHSGALLSETLYNVLFLGALAVLCWRPWSEGLSTPRLVLFAALFTGAIMVRPISVAVLPVLLAVWWWQEGSWRPALRRTGVTMAVVLVAIVPWTARNAIQMDSFVPLSTNTGDNLCIGHHPDAEGTFALTDNCNVDASLLEGPEGEVAHDRQARELAVEYLGENWDREPGLVWRRAFYMFEHDHDAILAVQSYNFDRWMDPDTEDRFITLADWYYAVVAVLGGAGLVVAVWFRRPDRLLLVGATVATAAVPLAFFGDARFKVPVIPLLAIAVGALVAIPALRRERKPEMA